MYQAVNMFYSQKGYVKRFAFDIRKIIKGTIKLTCKNESDHFGFAKF